MAGPVALRLAVNPSPNRQKQTAYEETAHYVFASSAVTRTRYDVLGINVTGIR